MYELFLVGCGASSKMSSEDIEKEIEKVGTNPFWFKFLFTSYIIVTLVGLLNFIIASMCDSYTKFTETNNHGWRQHDLKMSHSRVVSFFVSTRIRHPLFKKLSITERFVRNKNLTLK